MKLEEAPSSILGYPLALNLTALKCFQLNFFIASEYTWCARDCSDPVVVQRRESVKKHFSRSERASARFPRDLSRAILSVVVVVHHRVLFFGRFVVPFRKKIDFDYDYDYISCV